MINLLTFYPACLIAVVHPATRLLAFQALVGLSHSFVVSRPQHLQIELAGVERMIDQRLVRLHQVEQGGLIEIRRLLFQQFAIELLVSRGVRGGGRRSADQRFGYIERREGAQREAERETSRAIIVS